MGQNTNSLANGSCGLTDGSSAGNWRLPNVNELESLLNAEQADMIIWLETQGFSNVDAFYWSASTTANAVNRAWEVTMEDNGSVSRSGKNNTSFVWPVRAGQ